MAELLAIFDDYTLRTVALGAAVLGLLGGGLGTFAVLRRQSLLSDALAHATLPGVVIAFLLSGTTTTTALTAGAAVTATLGAGAVLVIVQRTRIKQDAALAIVLSVFFGLGTVGLAYVASTGAAGQSGLDSYVLGQAASLVAADVRVMMILTMAALAVVVLLYKELKLVSFDPGFARATGYPVRRIEALLTVLLVLAIVVGIRTVGVVLVAALLITPAAAARQWTDRLAVMIMLAAAFGAVSGAGGALVSASTTDLPTGPVIVLVATAIFLLSLPARRLRDVLGGAGSSSRQELYAGRQEGSGRELYSRRWGAGAVGEGSGP